MKHSLARHSCVQEVDNMHKQIEDALQVAEFYSPISFLRMLLKVNRKKPYRVIQMNKSDFKDFHSSSKMLEFCKVPHIKAFQIRFCKEDLHTIEYKLSHSDREFIKAKIGKQRKKPAREAKDELHIQIMEDSRAAQQVNILTSKKQKCEKQFNSDKKNNFRTMLKFMPIIDRH